MERAKDKKIKRKKESERKENVYHDQELSNSSLSLNTLYHNLQIGSFGSTENIELFVVLVELNQLRAISKARNFGI